MLLLSVVCHVSELFCPNSQICIGARIFDRFIGRSTGRGCRTVHSALLSFVLYSARDTFPISHLLWLDGKVRVMFDCEFFKEEIRIRI